MKDEGGGTGGNTPPEPPNISGEPVSPGRNKGGPPVVSPFASSPMFYYYFLYFV